MDTRKIIFYPKYFDMASDLTREQLGNVVWAIGQLFLNGDESCANELSVAEKILYKTMKVEIEANWEKYEETCEKRRQAGIISAQRRREAEHLLTFVNNNKNTNKNANMNMNENMNENKNNEVDTLIPFEFSPEDAERLLKTFRKMREAAREEQDEAI